MKDPTLVNRYFGVITARAGSKGIPKKNMQLIGAKPMLQYTLEAALGCKSLNYSILTSDDLDAIALSKKVGVNAPFVRPHHLSQDNVPPEEAVLHSLDWYRSEFVGYPEAVVLLSPTTPFRTAKDIENAIKKFEQTEKESLISVSEVSQHPSDCITVKENRSIEIVLTRDGTKSGRQGYRQVYFIDGGVYISMVKRFLKEKTMFDSNSEIIILPQSHGLDIDEPFDLELARAMINYSRTTDFDIFSY